MRVLVLAVLLGIALFLIGGVAVVPAQPREPAPTAELEPGVAQWVCAHTTYCDSTP